MKNQRLNIEGYKPLKVILANGTSINCTQMTVGLQWSMGIANFTSDFYSIPLGGYDLILGIQWLQEVSRVGFDFNKREVRLSW